MKLTIKHLAGYLPYGLQLEYVDCSTMRKRRTTLTGLYEIGIETTYKRKIKGCSGDLICWKGHNNVEELKVKPLLRSLFQLTQEIEHDGVRFVPLTRLLKSSNFNIDKMTFEDQLEYLDIYKEKNLMSWADVQILQEWHFDIFNLIEAGLAIELDAIPTTKPNTA